MSSRFSKKVEVYITYFDKYFDAYIPDEDGFPFVISNVDGEWKIVNKISGQYLKYCSFVTKKDAEFAFSLFEDSNNIYDIEWFDPLPDFNIRSVYYYTKGFNTINKFNMIKYEEANK